MKVILTEYIDNLGKMGDIVKVADGYGRNYLIPRKLAVIASPHNIHQFELTATKRAKLLEQQKAEQQQIADTLQATPVIICVKTGEEDRLFGSVTVSDIANAIKEKGIEIDRKKMVLQEPIKSLGNYTIPVKLHPEVTANVEVRVVKEETELSPG